MVVVNRSTTGVGGFVLRGENGELLAEGLTRDQAEGLAGYINRMMGSLKRRMAGDRVLIVEAMELLAKRHKTNHYAMICGMCTIMEKLGEVVS